MRGRPRPPPPWVHRNVSIRSSSDAAALAVRSGVRLHTDHRVAIEQVISLDTKAHHRRLGEALRAGGLGNWNREPEETRADPGGFEGGGGCHTFCLLSGGKIRGLPTFPWIRAWEEHCPQVFAVDHAPPTSPLQEPRKSVCAFSQPTTDGQGKAARTRNGMPPAPLQPALAQQVRARVLVGGGVQGPSGGGPRESSGATGATREPPKGHGVRGGGAPISW